MTDTTENLVLEHLKHIRGQVDALRVEQRDFRDQQSSALVQFAALRRDQAETLAGLGTLTVRFDRLDDRLERIEMRLGGA